jgi:hypothetical protein
VKSALGKVSHLPAVKMKRRENLASKVKMDWQKASKRNLEKAKTREKTQEVRLS